MDVGLSLGISPREPILHNVEVVQQAEALGFDSVWIADVQLSMKDCFTALTLCAVNTSKILLSTGVANPVTRHPSIIANTFTALNEISNGRAIVGLGTGWTGVFPIGLRPATIKYMEESITSIRKLCSGEEVPGGEKGPYHMVTSTGPIPIYIAANQPRMLRMCGRIADGVILMGGANEEFTNWQIDLVKEGAEQAGRSMDDIKLHLWANISMSDDHEQARDDVSHWVASQAETFSQWKVLPEFLEPYREYAGPTGAQADETPQHHREHVYCAQ